MKYKLGKKPARPGAVKLKFGDYFNLRELPVPPQRIGHELIGHDWGMLANDRISCCVVAGGAHEHMVWTHMGTRSTGVNFTDDNVISDYTVTSGYDGTEESDQGLDMSTFAEYRRKVGLIDEKGERHKIDAYVSLEPGNPDLLARAVYLTGAVGIGIRTPSNVDDLFDEGKPWDITPKTTIVGGHYIPVIIRNSKNLMGVITWGGLQGMTNAFYDKYCEEAIVYISYEALGKKGVTPDGFDKAALIRDVKVITS